PLQIILVAACAVRLVQIRVWACVCWSYSAAAPLPLLYFALRWIYAGHYPELVRSSAGVHPRMAFFQWEQGRMGSACSLVEWAMRWRPRGRNGCPFDSC